jgi:anaerobic dimethyl sulfoxide reductase subunit B (iron-sulfur subunit)
MACKDKNDTFVGLKYRSVLDYCIGGWTEKNGIAVPDNVAVYAVSYSCMHCEAPACVASCPIDAIIKRESDGVVYINEADCIGCGSCVIACPYTAPRMNTDKGVASKCDFCRSYIDNGGNPACVDACLMRCLEWGEIAELRTKYGSITQVDPLPASDITRPNYIINPSRFVVSGVSGSVINLDEELI